MTREKFEQLVEKLTLRAERSPALYKMQVIILALAGYFYIYFILGILLSVLFVLLLSFVMGKSHVFVLKLFMGLGFFAVIIVRSLWVKFDKPNGIRISSEQAPNLFKSIKELSAVLKTSRIHQVLIDDSYNAGIAQIPRFGLFGGYRNYLILGLPCLAALTPEQFRAVLAHELGHLSRAHGRTGSWVYRIRETWYTLLEQLNEKEHWGNIIFVPFFKRFVPYFDAFTFVLRRTHEYDADRYASELTSPEKNALSLITATIKQSFLSTRFWPKIYKMADDQSEPVSDVYTLLERALKEDIPVEDATRWLNEELSVETDCFDSHPSLAERLQAIGIKPSMVLHTEHCAAEFYLNGCLEEIESRLNRLWYNQEQENWRERYEQVQEYRKKLDDLNQKDVSRQLTDEESLDRACLIEELISPAEALPYYEKLLTSRQDDPRINFLFGRTLLSLNREQGVSHIEAAMGIDEEAILPGCEILWEYFLKNGRKEEAAHYYSIGLKHSEMLDQASEEREIINVNDEFCSHGIAAESLKSFIEELRTHPVKQAYLVQKTNILTSAPLYVLGISIIDPWYTFFLESKANQYKKTIVEKIAQELVFPGESVVFCQDFNNQRFKKIFKKIPGSRLI